MEDGPIIIVSRGVVKHGRRDEFIDLERSVIEQDQQESGTLIHALQFERDNPHIVLGYTVFRNQEAHDIHRRNGLPQVPRMMDLYEQSIHVTYCIPLAAKGVEF
ncbi:MAG TPA: antibiotic biosynthesis monooxygenase [Acidimicrobiales bacterium]|jgi:quinol monooxygenase YgiN|nr:antibiotic biosynthesis monooxygenase [Acidimicrobiales bacterium]